MELSRKELAKMKEEQLKLQRELHRREIKLKFLQEDLEKREQMFKTQWALLEHELSLFAKEREEFEREIKKQQYRSRLENEKTIYKANGRINAGMYFLGVHDELSLKKRYRDLLKLFHPDSMNGDVDAMQAINSEYTKLKKKYEEM